MSHPTQPVYTVPSPIQALLNPSPNFISNALPSYLSNSMIHILRDSTRVAVKRRKKLEEELEQAGVKMPVQTNAKGEVLKPEEAEERDVEEGLKERLEGIGRVVGAQIVEQLTIQRAPPPSHLEVVKFVCKEFFLFVYARQIDNLRTNHRGTFVLQSNTFPPLAALSTSAGPAADLELGKIYLAYPAAMVQGALAKLGMLASVSAESNGLPQCTFTIKLSKNQPAGTAYAGLTGSAAAATPAPPTASAAR